MLQVCGLLQTPPMYRKQIGIYIDTSIWYKKIAYRMVKADHPLFPLDLE